MPEETLWETLNSASAAVARAREIEVRRAIHLVAAAADAKRYAQWVIENADKALARLAEDGIYPDTVPAAERVNVVRRPELTYPAEKMRLALADLDSAHRVTHAHLLDARALLGEDDY